jgi:hypothetical protein
MIPRTEDEKVLPALAESAFFQEEVHVRDVSATMSKGECQDEGPEVGPLPFFEEAGKISEKDLERLGDIADNKHKAFPPITHASITCLSERKAFFFNLSRPLNFKLSNPGYCVFMGTYTQHIGTFRSCSGKFRQLE